MFALPGTARNQRLAFQLVEFLFKKSHPRLDLRLNFIGAVFTVFARMTRSHGALFICIVLSATASKMISAESNWTGEYANKNFLNGQAVFEFSIEQSADDIKIAFDAAYNDAHAAAPDGEGQAKI